MRTAPLKHPMRAVAAGTIAAAAIAATAVPAIASTTGARLRPAVEVSHSGRCSQHATWSSDMSTEPHNKIDVSFSVENAKRGSKWNVVIKHDGKVLYSGRQTVGAGSNGWEIDRLVGNLPGTDTLSSIARNSVTGEVCRATIRL